MNNINFDNPWLLIIGVPMLLLVIISFIITIRKENRTFNNVFSFICHIIICILLTLTLAKTTYEKVVTETNVYVLADVSYSNNNNLDLIDEYINKLPESSPENSKIGIVCFGKDYELLVEPGDEFVSVKNSKVDRSATNIAEAVEYVNTLFSDNVIKRIVIISDGEETKKSNIVSIVRSLSADDVYVDAIYVDNNLTSDIKEVQINSIDVNNYTYLNDNESVYVSIQSNVSTKSYVYLYCDGTLIKDKAIKLQEGFNSVSFELDTTMSGAHDYEVVVKADDDTSEFNNSYIFTQDVSEKIKVLFVSDNLADKEVAMSLYGDYADISYYVNEKNIPFTIEELAIYDEFVFSNVDIRNIYNYSQFINSVEVLVSEFGKSLVTFGNTYIQNNDDEILDVLADMLPVVYGKDSQDDKLVTLVIDISRSMEFLDRLNIAKNICYTILDNLDDNVNIMAICFYGEIGSVFSPMPASEREDMKAKIAALEPGQGTCMGSALDETYKRVMGYDFSKKEVILISDGLPYGEQEGTAKLRVKALAQSNVIVSTVHTVTLTGAKLMKELAQLGRGYYYFIESLKDVSGLVLNEVMNSLNETILEHNESTVSITMKSDELVDGISELPNIKGLYNNRKKSSGNVVLNATYTDLAGMDYDIPLYTYWDYGNGKVSSFASSLSGDWITNWHSDDGSKEVLSRFINVNKPEVRNNSAFIIESAFKGTMTEITVDAPTLNADSKLLVDVIYPNGNVLEKELIFDSRIYYTEIPTYDAGKYTVVLKYNYGTIEYSSEYVFSIAYSPEYNAFTNYDAANLYYMVSMNGKVSEDGNLVLENTNSIVRKYIIDFTPLFMIMSVVIFIIDVIVRKLRLTDIVSIFKKVKSEKRFDRRK